MQSSFWEKKWKRFYRSHIRNTCLARRKRRDLPPQRLDPSTRPSGSQGGVCLSASDSLPQVNAFKNREIESGFSLLHIKTVLDSFKLQPIFIGWL